MSVAVLGSGDTAIKFETSADKVRTWQEARMAAAARWATHDVYAGKPLREFLGPGLSTITMSIRLDTGLGLVPRDELAKMRLSMSTGAVLQFTVGGRYFGDVTISNVDEQWVLIDADGVLQKAIASLTLEEYL